MPYFTNHREKIYYEELGNKNNPPLILISGLGQDHDYWTASKNILAKRYKIILFDNIGTGRSTEFQSPESVIEMTESLFRLINFLCIPKAHILGHSMGGFIAQVFAHRYPKKVDRLILYSTGYRPSEKTIFALMVQYNLAKQNNIPKKLLIQSNMPWAYSNAFFSNHEKVAEIIKEHINYPFPTPQKTIVNQIKACANFDSRNFLSTIKAKTAIIHGNEDLLFSIEQNKRMAKEIPDASLIVIENTAHEFHIEEPKRFSNVIMKFLP